MECKEYVSPGGMEVDTTMSSAMWRRRNYKKYTTDYDYCKPSFVRGVLISRFLDQVPIHGVLYLRGVCLKNLIYVLNACNRHIRGVLHSQKDRPREHRESSRIKDGLQYFMATRGTFKLLSRDCVKRSGKLLPKVNGLWHQFFRSSPLPRAIGLTFTLLAMK